MSLEDIAPDVIAFEVVVGQADLQDGSQEAKHTQAQSEQQVDIVFRCLLIYSGWEPAFHLVISLENEVELLTSL